MKTFLPLLFILFFCGINFAQSNVEIALQLFEKDVIAKATLDQNVFTDWVKETIDVLEKNAEKVKGNHNIRINFSLHKDRSVTIEFFSKSEKKAIKSDKIMVGIDLKKSPRTKFVDFSMLMMMTINSGVDSTTEFSPKYITPYELKILDFKRLSLMEKKKEFERWMQEEVIPIAGYYETIVDPKFEGVVGIGEIVKKKKYLKKSVDELTSFNYDYWRAMLEMEQWNQLILFSKMCMYFANGQYDRGEQVHFFVQTFSNENSLAAVLNSEISEKTEIINNEISQLVSEGIALHDAGKYDEAIVHYTSVLKDFPNNAWLNYELYFSKSSKDFDTEKHVELWQKEKINVYRCDPMYYLDINASTGAEAYLLFRRASISGLFKGIGDFKTELLEYADIALELGNYAIAGEVYWLLFSHIPADEYKDRNLLMYYLYSLEKLDIKGIKDNFKGDFPMEFKKIEEELKANMEGNSMYKVFKKE